MLRPYMIGASHARVRILARTPARTGADPRPSPARTPGRSMRRPYMIGAT